MSRIGLALMLLHTGYVFYVVKTGSISIETSTGLAAFIISMSFVDLPVTILSWLAFWIIEPLHNFSVVVFYLIVGGLQWYGLGTLISAIRRKIPNPRLLDQDLPLVCPKCAKHYDTTWKICLNDQTPLVPR